MENCPPPGVEDAGRFLLISEGYGCRPGQVLVCRLKSWGRGNGRAGGVAAMLQLRELAGAARACLVEWEHERHADGQLVGPCLDHRSDGSPRLCSPDFSYMHHNRKEILRRYGRRWLTTEI